MKLARIKLAAAVVLLACLALPEYTCSKYVGPDGKVLSVGPNGVPTTPYREVLEKHYPLESFSPGESSWWITLVVYAWPWPVLLYWWRGEEWRRARVALRRTVRVVELLLPIGSGWMVLEFSSVGTRAVGAYLAVAANAVYLGACLSEWIAGRRKGRAPG